MNDDDAVPSSRPLPELIGGRYRIVSRLGVGGMGVVYKANDIQLNRAVAIKALEDRRVLMVGASSRLRTEALAAASLDHPYICKVYELVETPTDTFIVMEYVAGETLASIVKRGPLPLLQVLQFAREIAEGLANAHAHGLVHRDVKPANVMVTPSGHVKLLDFGVAGADVESTTADQTRTVLPQFTAHAATPQYMAPEQAAGQAVTVRADLFSLGVVMYECLTGSLPFSGSSTFDYVRNMMQSAPRRLDRIAPNTPADLVDLIERCLEKAPVDRPESADAIVGELRRLSAALTSPGASVRSASQARSGRTWKIVAAAALAVAAIAWGWQFVLPKKAVVRQMRPFVTSAAQEFGSRVSPDGQWVSFIASTGAGSQVLMQRVDGGEPRPLTLGEGRPMSQIWSPDGTQLACVLALNDGLVLQIYPAFFGGAPQQTASLGVRPSINTARLLRWIDRTIYLEVDDNSGTSLRRISLDAPTDLVNISATWTLAGQLKSVDVRPDGKAVVFAQSIAGHEDLWTANLDGSSARAITDDDFFDRKPLWSGRPDTVIFQSNRGGQFDLWQIEPRSGTMTQLTSGEMEKIAESTSIDGSVISFQRLSHEAQLWFWKAGDTAGQQLTQDTLSDYAPVVSENGRVVAFQRSQPTPSSGYTLFDAKLFVSPFDGKPIGNARPLVDGYAPALSADGQWLAYLQNGDRPARSKLQVRNIASGATTTLSSVAAAPSLLLYPVNWGSRIMAFARTSADLFFADHVDVATIHRFHPGDAAPGPPLARSGSPTEYVRDLYLSANDQVLAWVSTPPNLTILHTLSTATGAHRELTRLTGPASYVHGRGWLPEGFVLVRRVVLHSNFTADVEVLVVDTNGTMKRVGVITNAYSTTALLHPARRVMYLTRVENGVHNLYEFSFATGAVKALTRNALPGVTFSGFQDVGPDALIAAREERRQDIWLSQESGTSRPGNPAGR